MIYILIITILCFFLLFFLLIYKGRDTKKIWQKTLIQSKPDFTKVEHKWQEFNTKGLYYCNYCKKLLGGLFNLQAAECKKCGVLAHALCHRQKKNAIKCKYILSSKETSFNNHQWVDGNLPINSVCAVCSLVCTSYYDLEGSTCIWCQRVVHHDCKEKLDENCDFGALSQLIIRPNEVFFFNKRDSLKKDEPLLKPDNKPTEKGLIKRKKSSESFWKFMVPESKVIIVVIVNKKSGGQVGDKFLNSFYRYLNPLQVIDLLDEGLDKLKVFTNLNGKEIRLIVGGGDGTIGSVGNYIKSEIPEWMEKNPPIATLPLGTGNDLSRAMGWGGTYTTIDVKTFLQLVGHHSHKVLLDRWKVDINCSNEKNIKISNKNFLMYNYCGIGLDAKFCLSFHNLRETKPHLFQSRIGNKFIYGHLGTVDFLLGKRQILSKIITLTCDGLKIKMPDVENIIILNINYWGGGVYNLWGNKHYNYFTETANSDTSYSESSNSEISQKFVEQNFSDKVLEVIGIQSVLHLGQCQVGFASPLKICQGRNISLEIKSSAKQAIQIDGEPFELSGPFKIDFSFKDKINMLGRKIEQNYIIESKILKVLDQAENEGHISINQKEILLEKFVETMMKKKIKPEH